MRTLGFSALFFLHFFIAIATTCFSLFATVHYEILGIGSPSWDYVCCVNEEFLLENQIQKQDTVKLNTPRFKRVLSAARKIGGGICCPGGSCATTLRGLASLGISCGLVGVIGDDESGDILLKHLNESGVYPLYKRKAPNTFEILTCITNDQKRSFCLHFHPDIAITAEDIFPEYFQSPKIIHMQAYSLRGGACLEKCVELAKLYHKKTSLDLCDAALAKKYRERIIALLPKIDVLFLNYDEACALTQLEPFAALHFLRGYCPTVVLKLGEKGCMVATQDRIFSSPALEVHTVDTTGAGDFFCSGFLYGLVRELPLETCACYGNLCGGTSVEHIGTVIPKDRWMELTTQMQ